MTHGWICGAALSLLLVPAPAIADVDGDRYESDTWLVSMQRPKNWQMSEQSSYPNVLLWMSRRNPYARMLLSAERRTRRITAMAYAKETKRILETLGFSVAPIKRHSTGASWIEFDNCGDASDCKGKAFLVQAFLVANGNAYALTMSTQNRRIRGQNLRAFDYTLRSMRFKRQRPPTTPPPTTGNKKPDSQGTQ